MRHASITSVRRLITARPRFARPLPANVGLLAFTLGMGIGSNASAQAGNPPVAPAAPAASATPLPPAAAAPVPPPKKPAKASADAKREEKMASRRVGYSRAATKYFEEPELGTSYGTGQSLDAANEALQIVGQIIADRASGAALEQLLTKLRSLLGCSESKGYFPHTCTAMDAVRLTDLAGSGRALLQALLSDATALILKEAKAQLAQSRPENAETVLQLTIEKIPAVILPDLLRAAENKNTKAASGLVVRQLMEASLRELRAKDEHEAATIWQGWPTGRKVVSSAAIAFARCVSDTRSKAEDPSPLDQCPIMDYTREAAEALGIADENALFAARTLATDVLDALTLRKETTPDWNGRAAATLGALFATTCLLASPEQVETCPAVLPGHHPTNWIEWFSTVHAMLISALDRDVNGVLMGVSTALEGNQRKGMRLLGGVVQYAQTYADKKSDPASAHDARVKLLEDLTTEMTDRTNREGDLVWSLGGALQFVGGGRIPLESGEKPAVYGPVGLPIGIGLQRVDGGVHLALGIFDLGQYVSWEPGLEVATPSVEDALSPSVSIGYAWGKSFPGFVAGNIGYAPHYHFSDNTSRGSLNIGVAVGVYVPLIDLN